MASRTPNLALLPLVAALSLAMASGLASASSFNITSASTTAQTLGSGSGQTGSIAATGSLSLDGTTNAVTISGSNATLTNLGSILQTGSGRAIRDNTGVANLVVTNGSLTNSSALIRTADGDVIQMNKSPASVTLNNYGVMTSLNASAGGAQVIDFGSILSGANTVNNYAGAAMTSYNADAVRSGVSGVVYNAGVIRSIITNTVDGSGSDGIDAQSNTGAQITNDATGTIEGGRHGITGGVTKVTTDNPNASFAMLVTNKAGGIIQGDNGSGINIDGINGYELVTVVNAGLIVGNGVTGDGDGVDVDGLVNITNTGTIRSANAVSSTGGLSEGLSVGGGTITNSGVIEGLVAAGNANGLGRGISIVGNDLAGSTTGEREAIYGNATVVNLSGGVIRGQNDSAIFVGGARSGYTVSITNNAGGLLQGGGATTAAVQTGLDDDTLVNGGRIDGSSSGKAINLGGGNNTLRIVGGSAVVLGDIDGGTATGTNAMTIAPGAGNAFSYAGSISNFSTVEVQSGTVTLTGVSTYTGTTTISGGTLVLDGMNRLAAASALNLAGGTLSLANATGASAQAFSSLSLTGSSSISLGGSSLTFASLGTVASGATLAITGYTLAGSPTYALRVLGDHSSDASFRALVAGTTLNGLSASYAFDGTYTDIGFAAAVPEPSALALMLAGFGLVGVAARRRK